MSERLHSMPDLSMLAHMRLERVAEGEPAPTHTWEPGRCLGWHGPCERQATAHAHRMCVECSTEAAYAEVA